MRNVDVASRALRALPAFAIVALGAMSANCGPQEIDEVSILFKTAVPGNTGASPKKPGLTNSHLVFVADKRSTNAFGFVRLPLDRNRPIAPSGAAA